MDESTAWIVAFSHFMDFVQDLPVMLDEGDVEQYHHIIGLFENALDTDLSQFKVKEQRVKKPVQNPVPSWQTKLPARVDRTYFVSQVWNLSQYLKANIATTTEGLVN